MPGRYLVFDINPENRKVITCSYEKPTNQIYVIGEDETYNSKFDCFMATGTSVFVQNFKVDIEEYNRPQFIDHSKLVATIYDALIWLKLAPLEPTFVYELVEELRLDVVTPRLMDSSLHEFVCSDISSGEYIAI